MKITINSIKKTVLLAGGLFLSVLSVNADDSNNTLTGLTSEMLLPQFSKLTPEASSLGRFGAFQVSEYSGAANISIPLYTVKSGDVSFPINLYYDATGIKVEQDATFVGLGWNLSYGGMISHIVCGEDDFREYPGFTSRLDWWKEQKESFKTKYQELPFWIEPASTVLGYSPVEAEIWGGPGAWLHYKGRIVTDERTTLFGGMAKGYDVPDVFQASFCGHNISFAIDKRTGGSNGQYPIVVLNNNSRKYNISYKTDEIPEERTGYPSSFVITDDKGINYCFEAKRENVLQGFGIDSYYLTKIYGPDGENGKSKVEFYYDTQEVNLGDAYSTRIKNHQPTARRVYGDKFDDIISNSTCYSLVSNFMLSLTNTSSVDIACGRNGHFFRVYPKRITTNSETIVFTKSEKGKRLDMPYASYISGITITPNTGGTPRNILFAYDYFKETPAAKEAGSYSHRRLKLTDVTIDDKKYDFEYDDSIKLPSFASYSKDYWGYYNGANPNDSKFVGSSPAYTISNGIVSSVEHSDGSNRLASEKLCKVGMLKKVTYPTGGYTLYEFEANRFNDKYYYPDASKSTTVLNKITDFDRTIDGHQGSKKDSFSFKVSKETKYKLYTLLTSISGKKDVSSVILRSGTGSIIKELSSSDGNNMEGDFYITLSKGNYVIETTVSIDNNDGAPAYVHAGTTAKCYLSHENDVYVASTNGGSSIGGGLRVKTIKNYDSDGTYLNGVKYEYSGGKLLSPTVQLEKHHIDCYNGDVKDKIKFSFYYTNTEPSYLYICSLGIPAVVGYDRVVKKEVDESEKKIYRKTVLDFYNYGYITDNPSAETINSIMQNSFYFNSDYDENAHHAKGHLNGMIKRDSVFNGSVLNSTTEYDYKYAKLDTIYYQKCLPTHLPNIDNIENCSLGYKLAFYRKVITWNYLTSKTETLYDSNGKQTTSNKTSFSYNKTNYQLSDQSVTDGTNTSRTHYYYPSDKKVKGYQYLTDAHKISELTAIDTYRNRNYTGGSKFNYCKWKNTNLPVVNECYSITPSKAEILEMEVDSAYGYDNYGNIRQYKKKDGTDVTIIWSYNHQLPIMEIVGSTYTEVCNKAKQVKDITSLEKASSVDEKTMSSIHATLRKDLPNALVTAYTYSPWHSVSQIIKPNGEKTVYNYDKYGRLSTVLDANQPTFQPLQMYNYNYKK